MMPAAGAAARAERSATHRARHPRPRERPGARRAARRARALGGRRGPRLRRRPARLLGAARLREVGPRPRRADRRDLQGQRARPAGMAGGARRERLRAVPRRPRPPDRAAAPLRRLLRRPRASVRRAARRLRARPHDRRAPPALRRAARRPRADRRRRRRPRAAVRNGGAFLGRFGADAQRIAVLDVLEGIGFDPDSMRLDPTVHPFAAAIAPDDIRLTTKYDEQDFAVALYCGAARVRARPLRGAASTAACSARPSTTRCRSASTSRRAACGRTSIGRSRPFCAWLLPRLADPAAGRAQRPRRGGRCTGRSTPFSPR